MGEPLGVQVWGLSIARNRAVVGATLFVRCVQAVGARDQLDQPLPYPHTSTHSHLLADGMVACCALIALLP